MRLGLGFLALTALCACMEDKAARLAASWGCDPIEGLSAISRDGAPDWVLVGEVTETNETPAATADIACHLATDGKPVFVGVSQYLGGDTDAETQMLATLDGMIAKGAPLIVERIGDDDLPYAFRNRDRNEEPWAKALMLRLSTTGASRAVLLVAQADGLAGPIATGSGIDVPNPGRLFLPGKVVSLEAVAHPVAGLTVPTIRAYTETPNAFHGELAFSRLTRPELAIEYPEPAIATARIFFPDMPFGIPNLLDEAPLDPITGSPWRAPEVSRDEDPSLTIPRIIEPPLEPALDLPEFVVE